jgi:hypothetical protein
MPSGHRLSFSVATPVVRVLALHPAAIVRAVEARVVLRDDALEAKLASYLRIEERELEAGLS